MTIIRRIYAYLLAFAGLAMVSVAAATLIQVLVDLALQSSALTSNGSLRNTVSFSAAAALVGLPVWLLHWLWIGRSVRADPQERRDDAMMTHVGQSGHELTTRSKETPESL